MLPSGRLREPVELQEEATTPNGQGGFDSAGWATIANIRAEIVGQSGTEALKAGVERSVQQWRVRIRKRDGVNASQRLMWKGVKLAIRNVLPDPANLQMGLVLLCESGAID